MKYTHTRFKHFVACFNVSFYWFIYILLVCYLILLYCFLYFLHSWCGAPILSLYMCNEKKGIFYSIFTFELNFCCIIITQSFNTPLINITTISEKLWWQRWLFPVQAQFQFNLHSSKSQQLLPQCYLYCRVQTLQY